MAGKMRAGLVECKQRRGWQTPFAVSARGERLVVGVGNRLQHGAKTLPRLLLVLVILTLARIHVGSWQRLPWGDHWPTIAAEPLDLLYPRGEDFLLVPLRPLPPHPYVLNVDEGIRVETGIPAVKVRQTIAFGMPCLFGLAGRAVWVSFGAPLISPR